MQLQSGAEFYIHKHYIATTIIAPVVVGSADGRGKLSTIYGAGLANCSFQLERSFILPPSVGNSYRRQGCQVAKPVPSLAVSVSLELCPVWVMLELLRYSARSYSFAQKETQREPGWVRNTPKMMYGKSALSQYHYYKGQ